MARRPQQGLRVTMRRTRPRDVGAPRLLVLRKGGAQIELTEAEATRVVLAALNRAVIVSGKRLTQIAESCM